MSEPLFSSEELEKYARILLWGLSTARPEPYRPGEFVLLRFDPAALPLAEAVYDELLGRGLTPIVRQNLTSRMETSFFGRGTKDQITALPPGESELYAGLSGLISLIAPDSLTNLAGCDPANIGLAAVARKPLREIMDEREQRGAFGWTLCAYPTADQARCAGLTLGEYAEQIKRSCFLDAPDPAERWNSLYAEVEGLKKGLDALPVASLHIESEHTDLTVTPGRDRRWLGGSGNNIPSFELFLSPDWHGTKGIYSADQPSYRSGNRVSGVRLEFKAGRVVSARAAEGDEFLHKQLAMDEGAAQLGEFSLTDRRHSRIDAFMANTLFDENFGGEFGNCHVALGASYADTYSGDQRSLNAAKKAALGFNDSALHWDLVNTEDKTVTAALRGGGSKVIYAHGQFTV